MRDTTQCPIYGGEIKPNKYGRCTLCGSPDLHNRDFTHIHSLTITIDEYSDGGYIYDIYDTLAGEDDEPIDGGICTSTIENALDMAHGQAIDLLARRNSN